METSIAKLKGKVKVTKPRVSKKKSVPSTPREKKKTIGNLSLEQTAKIRKLTFQDGNPLLTPEVTYSILSLVKEIGFDDAYKFIVSKPWIDSRDLIFSLPTLDSARERARREIIISREKLKAVTGMHTCTYCGSKRTVTVEKQIRSCDEPTTQIVTCQDCGRKQRYG